MKTTFTNKYHIVMDNNGRLYQKHFGPFLPEVMKSFGVDCYYDDFYMVNKNTIGLKKHITDNPNWDPDKFMNFLIKNYSNFFLNIVQDQYSIENDKIIALDKFNQPEPRNMTILVRITEDDPMYEEALKAYRENN